MKTIQMTIDEPLLAEVDEMIKTLDTTRSAFIRNALQFALHHQRIKTLEQKHAEGYTKKPALSGEFDVWDNEQVWGSE